MSDLVERLTKRAKEDRQCAANSAIIADLLEPQMALFRASNPDAPWNTYTVRMAVDHANSVKRDTQYAIDLEVAAAELSRLSARVEELERAAEATDAIRDVLAEVCGDHGSEEHAQTIVRDARALLDRLVMHAPDHGVDEFLDAIQDARLLVAKIDGAE